MEFAFYLDLCFFALGNKYQAQYVHKQPLIYRGGCSDLVITLGFHDTLLSNDTRICMRAKTIVLIRQDRIRKWSSFHCLPVPNTNGVSLLGRQYADSHEICAIWSRSSLSELFDISRLNQSLRLDCTPRNLTSVFAIIIYQIMTVQYCLCFH